MNETRRDPEPARRRDLATRVEEQSERIAALSHELEEARIALSAKSSRVTDLEGEVQRQATQLQDVRVDARRMAEELVRVRDELKDGGGAVSPPPPAAQSAPDADRVRRELASVNQALASLRVSYREVETEILALQRASNEMIATQYLDEVLGSILSGVEEGLGYDLALLMVLDRAGGYFFPRVRPENGLAHRALEILRVSFDRLRIPLSSEVNALAAFVANPSLTVYDTPKPMLDGAEPQEEAEKLGLWLVTEGGQQSFAAVPMNVRGALGGAIFCARSRPGISARERESLQNFANQAGMAIENAQLVNDMRRVRDELHRKNEDLARTNDKLVELERTKEALTSMMVHDMKNPLTSIRGYLELLLDEPADKLPDELKHHVKVSYDSSGRLLEMVRDLLDISKMEAGKFKLRAEPLDLKALVQATFTEQSVVAKKGGKTIAVELEHELPQVTGDSDLISRVIVNLVSNSVKHTPKGACIKISIKPTDLVPGAPPESVLVIAIADDGEGIPKEFHEKIFEKFGTVETRSAGAPKLSTGLGLTFCKMAVEAHGGKIWVESEPKKGATFFVALRRQPPE